MTKEQLKADNERLGAEVAALRELLTVIGSAGLPRHAPGQEGFRALQSADRLRDITGLARGLMRYAGSPVFPRVVFTTTETLRGIIAAPLAYRASEGALPAPIVVAEHCSGCGEVTAHADGCEFMPAPPVPWSAVITDSERTCDQANPITGAWCHKSGAHKTHRDTNGDMWGTAAPGPVHPHCIHCDPAHCNPMTPGHLVACQTPDCPSRTPQLVRAS